MSLFSLEVLALPIALGQIGFVSHVCPQRRQRLRPCRSALSPADAGQIGFVWRDRSRRRHRQPCWPLPTAVRVGIGFVWPRPFPGPICHNSLSPRYLPFVPLWSNWLCFARFGECRRHGRPWRPVPFPAGTGELALFRTIRLCGDSTLGPASPRPFPPRPGIGFVCSQRRPSSLLVPHFTSSTTIGDRLPRCARNDRQRLFMSLRGAQRRSNLLPLVAKLVKCATTNSFP
jgi:hypothetical protein